MDDRDFKLGVETYGTGDTSDLISLAQHLDSGLNVDRLLEYIRSKPFYGRKEFCKFLGIGESTLSGWLKEGGSIPKMVKLVVGLLMVGDLHVKELKALEASTESSDRLVRDGDKFMIVSFSEGEGVGRIAAREVPDEATGLRLISHQVLKGVLENALLAIMVGPGDELTEQVLEDIQYHIGDRGAGLRRMGARALMRLGDAEETDGSSTDGATADK